MFRAGVDWELFEVAEIIESAAGFCLGLCLEIPKAIVFGRRHHVEARVLRINAGVQWFR